MKSIFSRIFNFQNKKNEPENLFEQSFRNQINFAVEKCKREKTIEYNKVSEINKWAKEIIFEIFQINQKFWYDELNKYEAIKADTVNSGVSQKLIEKTDRLIYQYREQINLGIKKIEFFDTLLQEYEIILEQYEETTDKIKKIDNEQKKITLINKYQDNISEMQSGTEDFSEIIEETELLEILNEEIKKIEDDFNVKSEVNSYINRLDKELFDDKIIDSRFFIDEIEKLKRELKK
jgi:Cu/Ag efflux protein CusF